jgi:hypothetical protein
MPVKMSLWDASENERNLDAFALWHRVNRIDEHHATHYHSPDLQAMDRAWLSAIIQQPFIGSLH